MKFCSRSRFLPFCACSRASASIGSSFEALRAGRNPNATPIAVEHGDDRRDSRWNDRNDHRYDRDHKWKRGDRLGDHGRSYREIDYRRSHLRATPRGYHYVRDNNTGEILLAATASGIIASIILN